MDLLCHWNKGNNSMQENIYNWDYECVLLKTPHPIYICQQQCYLHQMVTLHWLVKQDDGAMINKN